MNMKTRFQNLATRLIQKTFGDVAQPVIIRHPLYSNYDESTGALITNHEDFDVIGILGPWVDNNQAAANSDDIRVDDLSLLISKVTLDIEPELNIDTVILQDGSEWAIVYSEKDEAEATLTLRLSKGIED